MAKAFERRRLEVRYWPRGGKRGKSSAELMADSLAALTTGDPATAAAADVERRFERFAWGVLGYTVLVILFGAVVRITGSGAGCGQHWPTCHGEVVHLPKSLEAAIELTHRLTSGLSLVFTFGLFLLSRKSFERGHRARRAAAFALVFMLGEVLIGALLVLLRLVAKDASVARAIVMPAHLVNTSFLTGSLALAAWLAKSSRQPTLHATRGLLVKLAIGIGATLVVSTSGALTALGDTLYPLSDASTLAERVSGAHFLERLRWLHPLLAASAALYLLWLSSGMGARFARRDVAWLSRLTFGLVLLQTALGILNILLSAPGYMQVVHLAAATLLWIALVVLSAGVLDAAPNERVTPAGAA